MATTNSNLTDNTTLQQQEGIRDEALRKLAKNIVTNLSEKELLKKEEGEGEVVCKMLIKGKASKLRDIIAKVLDTYYGGGGTYLKAFDTELKVTFMIEKVKDSQK